MKKILPVLLALFLLTSVGLVAAQVPASVDVRGNISSPFNTTGVIVDIFTGSNSVPNITFTIGTQDTTGFGPSSSAGTYSVAVPCNNDCGFFVKVLGINGTAVGCVFGQLVRTNATASLVANDASCKYSNACSSGICCSGTSQVNSSTASGTCKATCAAAAADPVGGSSPGPSGGGPSGKAPAAPAEPSKETVDVVKDALPATFQEAAAAGNVEYKTIAAPEVKEVPVAVETVTKTIEQLITVVQTEEAKQALSSIRQAVSTGGGGTTVSVTKTIEVVKATNKATKEEVTVSVVKLTIEAKTADLKNVEVVEVIPKAVANNINQVTFKGEKPVVLQADPVVKWAFAEILKGQKKDLSYAVNKDISGLNTNTIAVSKKVELPAQVPAPPGVPEPGAKEEAAPTAKVPTPLNTIVLVVIVAVVVVGGWLFLKSRKKVMK